ncbi:hypothetical protein I316_06261 [Kwoniella heveanensis BCC8398]|uniref:Uncharacterized protein n=1 Tax=Kwoniella heveanensis BCC8398 TaxID=1296120 RepID=A0A1B9GMN6_9TREE|nr:hypothetical protein I316_06261 [Kwoniella heveanensis BCC8398]
METVSDTAKLDNPEETGDTAMLQRLPTTGNLAIANPAYSAEPDADLRSGSRKTHDFEAGPNGDAEAGSESNAESDVDSIGSVIVVTRATDLSDDVTTHPSKDVVATDPSDNVTTHLIEDADLIEDGER